MDRIKIRRFFKIASIEDPKGKEGSNKKCGERFFYNGGILQYFNEECKKWISLPEDTGYRSFRLIDGNHIYPIFQKEKECKKGFMQKITKEYFKPDEKTSSNRGYIPSGSSGVPRTPRSSSVGGEYQTNS